jgi:DNA-binding FrmR family transcriptional regulator
VQIPDDVRDDLRKRLRRAEGQVRAVERMLDDDTQCRDIVTQLSAAARAIENAGFRLLAAGLAYCVEDPDAAASEGVTIAEVERLFMKLS